MKIAFRRGVLGFAAAGTAAALTLSFAAPAQALTATIDVQQLSYGPTQSAAVMAQTFTAGTTAQLVRVSIPFYTSFGNVKLGIQGVNSNQEPDGTYLTSQEWSGYQLGGRTPFDFDLAQPIPVTKGHQYAIVVAVNAGRFNWYYSSFTPPSFTNAGKLFDSACDSGCQWFSGGSFGADFGFETWVASGVVTQALPTVSANNTSVNFLEGAPETNSGTYSDPDGDTVSLSASSGSITKTGTSSGTWSWSAPASDETATAQTVTIKADDGQGQTATTSFNVIVSGVAPKAQITSDPATVPEGTAEAFTGTGSSPDSADNTAGFTYSWGVTKNGSPYEQGSGSSFRFTPDDEGTFVVTFSATDDGGMTGSTSMTITGTNVAPTAAINSVTGSYPLVTTANELLTFGGSFSDPGKLDSHTATWNFGDGSSSVTPIQAGGSTNLSALHSYASAGTYNVSLTVTDDDGGVGQATTSVTVQTTQQALNKISGYVQGQPLSDGQKQSLLAKLNAAGDAAARGDNKTAHNQLDAFLNEVSADLKSGKLTQSQADNMRGAVYAIQGTLGTYDRFLEWLLFAV